MVNRKKVNVVIILDETGSMVHRRDETISGFNEYLIKLKNDKTANFSLSLTKFNSAKIEVVYSLKKLSDVYDLNRDTYNPDNMTPLFDAVGKTILEVEKKIGKTKKQNVLICVITDGLENASIHYTKEMVAQMVADKKKIGWDFFYMYTNIDEWLAEQQFGAIGTTWGSAYDGSSVSYTSTMYGATIDYVSNKKTKKR